MIELKLRGETYQKIGEMAGVSRQRVQQKTAPPPKIKNIIFEKYDGICQECGKQTKKNKGHIHHNNGNGTFPENYNDIENLVLVCTSCHRTLHAIPTEAKICPTCKKSFKPLKYKKKKYCSSECLHKAHWTLVQCKTCKKLFEKRNNYLRRQKKDPRYTDSNFCSKRCVGRYAGSTYGYGSHYKNI